jgi:hypothetical protein
MYLAGFGAAGCTSHVGEEWGGRKVAVERLIARDSCSVSFFSDRIFGAVGRKLGTVHFCDQDEVQKQFRIIVQLVSGHGNSNKTLHQQMK